MTNPILMGDANALYMAFPWEAAQALAQFLPPGPVLELCCGVGGATRVLAQEHQVLAVDQDPLRLKANQANLHRLGLANQVDYLCCDLTRPALLPPPGCFTSAVLDPDWSPEGCEPQEWADDLSRMRPPADDLVRWALGFCGQVFLRLPRGLSPDQLTVEARVAEVYNGLFKITRLDNL